MRFRRPSSVLSCALLLAAMLLAACDPKVLNGTGGGNDDDDEDDVAPQVSNQARAVGQIVALHMDMIAKSLSVASEFDSAPALAPRSIFPTTCMTLTTIDPSFPYIDLSLVGCIDAHGTEYRGGALLAPPIDETDGFLLAPYLDAADKIIATNRSEEHT